MMPTLFVPHGAPTFALRPGEAGATRAHPSEEHFMPFFVALGAAGKQAVAHRFHQGVDDLVIAMDGYQFGRTVQ